MLHHQSLLYIFELIRTELISKHYNNPLAGHFGIGKTWELIARKYYWKILQYNVKTYVKGCNIYSASKTIKYKPYRHLHLLPIPTYYWKDLLINFMTKLLLSTNWKGNSYISILVIVNRLTKMIYCKPIQTTIDVSGVAKVIIDVIV